MEIKRAERLRGRYFSAQRTESRRCSFGERVFCSLMMADEIEEELMDAGVVGELGVEGGGEEVA